jgi:hypothetical protein
MSATVLSLALLVLAPAPRDDRAAQPLEHRMNVGRVGVGVAFVLAMAGLTILHRRLGREARDAEHADRVERAYRELEDELAAPPPPPTKKDL